MALLMNAPGPDPLTGSVKEEPADDDNDGYDCASQASSQHDDITGDEGTRKGPRPNILQKKRLTRRESLINYVVFQTFKYSVSC